MRESLLPPVLPFTAGRRVSLDRTRGYTRGVTVDCERCVCVRGGRNVLRASSGFGTKQGCCYLALCHVRNPLPVGHDSLKQSRKPVRAVCVSTVKFGFGGGRRRQLLWCNAAGVAAPSIVGRGGKGGVEGVKWVEPCLKLAYFMEMLHHRQG